MISKTKKLEEMVVDSRRRSRNTVGTKCATIYSGTPPIFKQTGKMINIESENAFMSLKFDTEIAQR